MRSRNVLPILFACVLAALGVLMRLLPHPANVTPVAAIALFSGSVLPKRLGWMIPIAVLAVTDIVLGLHVTMPFTWGSMLLAVAIGRSIGNRRSVQRVVTGSLAGSILFYLITNWAVWAFTPLYDTTLSGLALSYTAAIPFFRNSLLGDLAYAGFFFGTYALVRYAWERRMALARNINLRP